MPERQSYDAVVVGSGPNGLAAAVVLLRAGLSVLVLEAKPTPGGGTRSAELLGPGYVSDVCSAIHPLGAASPLFRQLPLFDFGLSLVHSPLPLAHPLDGGRAAVLERDLDATAARIGLDRHSWRTLFEPFLGHAEELYADLLAPVGGVPLRPWELLRFGLLAMRSAQGLCDRFRTAEAKALFAGCAAHAIVPLHWPFTAAIGLLLGLAAFVDGWPLAEGGSQRIADALTAYVRHLGGEVQTGFRVGSLAELPRSRVVLFDTTPGQLVRIAGDALPAGYRRRLARFRHGPASFKLDLLLDGPIPWRAPECARAATVHVGGTLDEIAASEQATWRGEHPERPFVLVAQQSLFDPSRTHGGKQVVWAYCHVPRGSTVDMTSAIEAQIERFAPGFRDRILGRVVTPPALLEAYNENYVGGDIAGGASDFRQLLTRPLASLDPYATPNPALYLCSSSTPPGAGVHGMCGYYAARSALRRSFGRADPEGLLEVLSAGERRGTGGGTRPPVGGAADAGPSWRAPGVLRAT